MLVFAAVFIALYAGHQVGDHWIQSQGQADHKGCDPDHGKSGRHEGCSARSSRLACALHVAGYGATQLVALGVLVLVLDLAVSPAGLVVGMALNLGTHYVADRRVPLRRLADRLGKSPAWLDHGGGMYALDQSWHVGWLFVSAVTIAAL